MLKIDNLLAELKDVSEWKQFAESQYQTIVSLTHKKQELEEKVQSLEKMISQTTPMLIPEVTEEFASKIEASDEEMICRMEIRKLRDVSLQRALTLDETRQLQTFADVLNKARGIPKDIEVKAKKVSTKELLALVEADNEPKQ